VARLPPLGTSTSDRLAVVLYIVCSRSRTFCRPTHAPDPSPDNNRPVCFSFAKSPMPSSSTLNKIKPFRRFAWTRILLLPIFEAIPCLIAFSTRGCRIRDGTAVCATAWSTSNSTLRRNGRRWLNCVNDFLHAFWVRQTARFVPNLQEPKAMTHDSRIGYKAGSDSSGPLFSRATKRQPHEFRE
jgi:hypothetical protein